MSTQKTTLLFTALFGFMIAWSIGLAGPLLGWLNPQSEMASYFINKGALTLVFAAVLWRLQLFNAVGFAPGMGLRSYVIALPLLALGVLGFLDPSRPTVAVYDLVGWAAVVLFVAFTEEGLFRGVLWKALSEAGPWTRAAVSAAMFGLAHLIPAGLGGFGWGIAGIYGLWAFCCGLIFAAIRESAGTIWSVIIVHAVFDLAAISASGGVDSLLDPGRETYLRFLTAAIVAAIWGCGAIYLNERRAKREGVRCAN